MSKFDTIIDNKIIQNLFIWCCLLVILVGTVQSDARVLTAIYIVLLLAPAVYINNLLILPFFNKNRIVFIALFLANLLVFTGISVTLISVALQEPISTKMFANFMGILFLAIVFGATIKIARNSFLRRQEEKNAELKLLKAQLNPHFLFNTLNNLYGLSVIKSDKLPQLMLKLSDLLRYSLYDTRETYVPLEKEIKYLENYISLEAIRLEDQTTIDFNKSGNLSSKSIAPMLLIVFVENAFKHLGSTAGTQSSVLVDIAVQDNQLIFKCVNSIDHTQEKEQLETGKSGIGLENAKKRLAFLYPQKHKLIASPQNNNYIVNLTLDF